MSSVMYKTVIFQQKFSLIFKEFVEFKLECGPYVANITLSDFDAFSISPSAGSQRAIITISKARLKNR